MFLLATTSTVKLESIHLSEFIQRPWVLRGSRGTPGEVMDVSIATESSRYENQLKYGPVYSVSSPTAFYYTSPRYSLALFNVFSFRLIRNCAL
jgi:hypothetical protein